MIIGINANNQGRPLGAGTVELIRERGFQMIRVPATYDLSPFGALPPVQLEPLVQEILDAGLVPLPIIRDADQIGQIPAGVPINFGNEPDLSKFGWTESTYRRAVMQAIPVAENRNPLWIGVVSNLNSRGFKFLKSLPWREIPLDVGADVHRYPEGSDPMRSHMRGSWFGMGTRWSRDEEIRHLREIVGDRPIACSEVGYTLSNGISEARQAECMAFERAFWERHGAVFACAYTLNDGETGNTQADGNYGFRRNADVGGGWKPVTAAWTGVTV